MQVCVRAVHVVESMNTTPPLSHMVPLDVQYTGTDRQQTNGIVKVLSIISLTQNKTHKAMSTSKP